MAFGYGAGAYQQVRSHGGVESADPHGLITLLMDGALERLVKARAHMVRGEVAAKGEAISRCIEILGGLRGSLDRKADPVLVERLRSPEATSSISWKMSCAVSAMVWVPSRMTPQL